jgi:hypothetical protein
MRSKDAARRRLPPSPSSPALPSSRKCCHLHPPGVSGTYSAYGHEYRLAARRRTSGTGRDSSGAYALSCCRRSVTLAQEAPCIRLPG